MAWGGGPSAQDTDLWWPRPLVACSSCPTPAWAPLPAGASEPGQKKAIGDTAPSVWPEFSAGAGPPVYEEASTMLLVACMGV